MPNVFMDHAHFDEVCRFAKAMGPEADKSLSDCLEYLANYANRPGCTYEREGTRCKLYKDWAPHSFAFVMEHGDGNGGYKFWFNGGLIYQGPDCPGDGSFPSLSVSLSDSNSPKWGIHT